MNISSLPVPSGFLLLPSAKINASWLLSKQVGWCMQHSRQGSNSQGALGLCGVCVWEATGTGSTGRVELGTLPGSREDTGQQDLLGQLQEINPTNCMATKDLGSSCGCHTSSWSRYFSFCSTNRSIRERRRRWTTTPDGNMILTQSCLP